MAATGSADQAADPVRTDLSRPGLRTDPDGWALLLRERVYATLTGLSAVLILLGYANETSAGSAASSIAVTMCGLFAASLVADLVSHTAVHGSSPSGSQRRQIIAVAWQAGETALVPVLVVALAGTGIWTVRTGLLLAAAALVLTLTVIAVYAVRGSTFGPGRRAVVVVGEVFLGSLVIGIKLLAH